MEGERPLEFCGCGASRPSNLGSGMIPCSQGRFHDVPLVVKTRFPMKLKQHRTFAEFCEMTSPMRQPTWLFGDDVLSQPLEDLREFLQWLSQEQQTWEGSSASGTCGEAAGAETSGDKLEDGGKAMEEDDDGKTMEEDGGKTMDMVEDGGKDEDGGKTKDLEDLEALKRRVQENRAKALEKKRLMEDAGHTAAKKAKH